MIGGSANSTSLLSGSYGRGLGKVDGFTTGGFPALPEALRAVLNAGDPSNEPKATTAHSNKVTTTTATTTVEYHAGMECLLNHPPPSASQICDRPRPNATLQAEAVAAAETATQVIVVLNLQSATPCDAEGPVDGEFNPCGYEAEQHDRYHTDLPRVQEDLALAVLKATKKAGVPTVVVLIHGGALSIERIKEQVRLQ